MAILSESQIEFLDEKGIPLDEVFDATGMKPAVYGELMKLDGKAIAIGVTPCKALGHSMRTRAGHCVQCKPESYRYLKRHEESGFVYAAYSADGQLSKIGIAKDPEEREKSLKKFSYAGCDDWVLEYQIPCAAAGLVETKAHSKLQEYWSPYNVYMNKDHLTESRETFDCQPETCVDAIILAYLQITPDDRVEQLFGGTPCTYLDSEIDRLMALPEVPEWLTLHYFVSQYDGGVKNEIWRYMRGRVLSYIKAVRKNRL